MNIPKILNEIQSRAMKDANLRIRFLQTREEQNPLNAFCSLCRELGYEIYSMDVISAGEEFYAEIRRATNGGGENSPKLEGEDDFYEDFFVLLMRKE